MTTALDAIRSCKYLFLGTVTEPEENALCITLLEASSGPPPSDVQLAEESDPARRAVLAGARPIGHHDDCRRFELLWDSYIGYSVLNESYARGEQESSNGKGRLIVEYDRSCFLEYLSRATIATPDFPGPFKHWAIHCLNHVIDIASQSNPEVRVLPHRGG